MLARPSGSLGLGSPRGLPHLAEIVSDLVVVYVAARGFVSLARQVVLWLEVVMVGRDHLGNFLTRGRNTVEVLEAAIDLCLKLFFAGLGRRFVFEVAVVAGLVAQAASLFLRAEAVGRGEPFAVPEVP